MRWNWKFLGDSRHLGRDKRGTICCCNDCNGRVSQTLVEGHFAVETILYDALPETKLVLSATLIQGRNIVRDRVQPWGTLTSYTDCDGILLMTTSCQPQSMLEAIMLDSTNFLITEFRSCVTYVRKSLVEKFQKSCYQL